MRGDFAFEATLLRSEQLPQRLQLAFSTSAPQHNVCIDGRLNPNAEASLVKCEATEV